MAEFPLHSPQNSPPQRSAWLLSVVIHAAVLAALGMQWNAMPRGTGDSHRGSMGLLVNHSTANGSPDTHRQYTVTQAVALSDVLVPPALLAAAPLNVQESPTTQTDSAQNQNAQTDNTSATQQPAATNPSSSSNGSKPTAAKPAKSSGKSTGRTTSARPRFDGSSSGNYTQTSIFGVQGKGSKFIYLFDRSGSMEGAPLAAAKKQLIESLQSLDTVQQFQIIFFNTRTQPFEIPGAGHRIAFASDRNKRLAANFIGGITADGGTDRMNALKEAISFAPDVIFFLTDDDDPMPPDELAELARANRKAQATICVIEFGRKPRPTPNDSLAQLAHDNGGQYGYVDTTKLH